MKEIFKNLSKGIFIGLGIVFVLGISYLAIKAWQTTNPGIAETTPLGGFYVNNGDTLSANKRNAMVDKVMIWQEVVISDTAAFDTQCMRRFFLDNGSADGYLYPRYIAPTQVTMSDPLYNRRIDSGNKTNFYVSGTTPTPLSVLKIEKLCP